MLTFTVISFLLGAVLGARFQVGVLFPVMAVALMIVAADAVVQSAWVWSAAMAAVLVLTGLQVGFLVGAATSDQLRLARCRRHPSTRRCLAPLGRLTGPGDLCRNRLPCAQRSFADSSS
jgi:hypothetical protein